MINRHEAKMRQPLVSLQRNQIPVQFVMISNQMLYLLDVGICFVWIAPEDYKLVQNVVVRCIEFNVCIYSIVSVLANHFREAKKNRKILDPAHNIQINCF